MLAGLLTLSAPAGAERPLSLRFTDDTTGNVAIVANALITCPISVSPCPAAQQGSGSSGLNNNNYPMVLVDDDGDATTFDSSGATLSLPDGATVLFAGLYYGARSSGGTGGDDPPDDSEDALKTVKLRLPGEAAYLTLGPADTVLDTSTSDEYAAFVDVTDEVAAAGSGEYFVADVQAGTGVDRFAGWALVVVYQDTAEPVRNLTVFDGLASVRQNSSTSIPVTGFTAPAAGPVRTALGFVAYEGDRGASGDGATLDNEPLLDPLNLVNNVFNSTVSRLGAHFTAKSPSQVNQFGFDADLLNANGIIANGATSAVVRGTTTSDSYLPQVVTFATELHAPGVEASKSVENITSPGGPTGRGDMLRYTVALTNTGQDGATGVEVADAIPGGSTYVPGSLALLTGPGAPASPTDAAGDDVAELDAANGRVVFRLGTGANAADGGLIAAAGSPDSSSSFSFDVTVDADNPDGAEIVNQASAEFFAQTLGIPLSADTAEVTSAVVAPDLTIAKTHTGPLVGGATTPFTIEVENIGGAATDGSTVTVSDTFPAAAFASITVTSATGWSCNVVATALTCTRSDALAAAAAYPPIQLDALVVPSPPGEIDNTATVAGGGDSDATNNASTDVGPAVLRADLQLTKTLQRRIVLTGGTVLFTLRVRNGGPSTATGVVVNDPLAPNFSAQSATSTQGTCDPSVACTIGTLAPGEAATVTITATVTGTGPSHDNTATVTSGVTDPTTTNDSAIVTVTVPNTADLALTKSFSPANPDAGVPDGLTYTLVVENAGPATATNVRLTDPLPAQFTPSSAGGGGFTCNLPGAGGTLLCTRPTLAVADGPVTITVVGTIAPAAAAQVIKNSASVDADEGDPVTADDSATTNTLVTPAADLDVTKTADQTTLRPGELATYTLAVSNLGPDTATNVVLTDTLGGPSRAILSVTPSQGTCTTAAPVECALGDIASGAQATVTLVVRALAAGTLTNSAAVSSDIPDPVTANGSSGTLSTLVAAGPLRLIARDLLVFRKLRSGVSCRLSGSPLRSCTVRIRTLPGAGNRLLASGNANAGGAGRATIHVRLRLTPFGRSLLNRRLGGVPVQAHANGVSTGGERRNDGERVRAIIDPERFRTPPGAWVPDQAVLTASGKRFFRNLRGRLIAVRRVVCEGHTARITNPRSRFSIDLSRARARVACARLRGLGVRAPHRIVFKGGTQQIASDATEAGRRQNRRVEVVLRH